MMPPENERLQTIDTVEGKGALVFPDGKRIIVMGTIKRMRKPGFPMTHYSGQIWDPSGRFRPGDYLSEASLVLELEGRRLQILILDQDGNFKYRGGVNEGFD